MGERSGRGLRRAVLALALAVPGCAAIMGYDFDRPPRRADAGAGVDVDGAGTGTGSGEACAVPCAPAGASVCVSGTTLRKQEVRGCGPDRCAYPSFDAECPEGCKDGACVGADPCAGVSCVDPPAASCGAGGRLVTLSNGRCQAGKCSYEATETVCANGCEDGACKGEPCAGVTCTSPPPAVCANASTRRSYASTGTCQAGSCSYAAVDTACPNGCENGACKSDPCLGVSCTQPPAAVCANGSTRRTYASTGTCQAGSCSYAATDTACANGCAAGACITTPPSTAGMLAIPAGSFQMGSNNGNSNEEPVHTETVGAFLMDEFEVTVDQYATCVSAGKCTAAGTFQNCNAGVVGRGNHPINCVDWNQADAYCTSVGKRLPTEAEWEYAARGTDGREYPWGNASPASQLCWSGGATSRPSTCAVGSYPSGKSPFGVQDMAGNVWEWTSSLYASNYSSAPTGTARVNRGGSWSNYASSFVRSAFRYFDGPSIRFSILGFRCAR